MKNILTFILAAACLGFGQTQIDLSKQKGIVPIVNGGSGNNGGLQSMAVGPTAINFGTVQTNTDGQPQAVTINNPGNVPVTVTSVVIAGSTDFRSSNLTICNGALDPGGSCVILVYLHPTAAGARPASTITVNSSAPVEALNPPVVPLSGSGSAAVTFPLTVNCGGFTGNGTITSGETPPLINATCTAGTVSGAFSNSYATGSVVALTATAANLSTFGGFTGCGLSTSPGNCTVSGATTVNAAFNITPVNFMLNIIGLGPGTVTVSSDINDVLTGTPLSCTSTAGVLTGKCNASFAQGAVPILTETPLAGTTFLGWVGLACGTATTCPITMNAKQTVTVNATVTASVPISLIQSTTNCSIATASHVKCTWAQPMNAGDAILCQVYWADATTTVTAISDTKGNTYTVRAGPQTATSLSDVVYSANNIAAAAAGANITDITSSTNAASRGAMCAEYAGVATAGSPLDATHTSTGNASNATANAVTTLTAGDLITGWTVTNATVQTGSIAGGYTQQIVDVGHNDEEDQQGGGTGKAIGTYTFQPLLSNSGTSWITFNMGWKAQGTGGTTITSLSIIPSGAGGGTIAMPNGGTCIITGGVPSGTCSAQVASGSSPTVLATAGPGSTFAAWQGVAGCSSNVQCTVVNINGSVQLTAVFNLAGSLNYYVGGAGASDSNDGLAPTVSGLHGPWLTIPGSAGNHSDAAVALGSSGTVINVASGNYTGPITSNKSGTATQRITYNSTVKWGAKITPINWSMNGSYTTVQGFDGTGPGSSSSGDPLCTPSGPPYSGCVGITAIANFDFIYNNYLHDFNVSGCAPVGVIGNRSFQANVGGAGNRTQDMQAIGNIIRHSGNYNALWGNGVISCVETHGIYDGGIRSILENNIISGVTGWGIKSDCVTNTIISNNTVFNNGGGITTTELNDAGFCAKWDYSTIENNVVVNNGTDTPVAGRFGLNFYHITGTHNRIANNLVYGNKPTDYAHHDITCNPIKADGTPNFISGSDANGDAGGCPNVNPQTDASTTVTFSSFVADTNSAPISPSSSYNAQNYRLKAGSAGINNGSTLCPASGGGALTPCVPSIDFNGLARPQGPAYDMGAFEP